MSVKELFYICVCLKSILCICVFKERLFAYACLKIDCVRMRVERVIVHIHVCVFKD